LIHGRRFDRPAQFGGRLRRFVRDGFASITAVAFLAVILIAIGLLRLFALPSSHPAIAEALHRVGEAMGPPF
jgi:hypothetical protein